MPLTTRGVLYLFFLVGSAIFMACLVIRGAGILDDDVQYAVTIALIVLNTGIFFRRMTFACGVTIELFLDRL
ncbi:MAG: hypothetical protein ABI857_05790 [Acidobacteriota bacterium]